MEYLIVVLCFESINNNYAGEFRRRHREDIPSYCCISGGPYVLHAKALLQYSVIHVLCFKVQLCLCIVPSITPWRSMATIVVLLYDSAKSEENRS
jgi:hypothetical protein